MIVVWKRTRICILFHRYPSSSASYQRIDVSNRPPENTQGRFYTAKQRFAAKNEVFLTGRTEYFSKRNGLLPEIQVIIIVADSVSRFQHKLKKKSIIRLDRQISADSAFEQHKVRRKPGFSLQCEYMYCLDFILRNIAMSIRYFPYCESISLQLKG